VRNARWLPASAGGRRCLERSLAVALRGVHGIAVGYVAGMNVRVCIVQHGEKRRTPGDPGLTQIGRAQADVTARWLAHSERPAAVWSSPLRRALETAAPIARELAVDVRADSRLRERMNWDNPDVESLETFLEDWHAASTDRSHQPRSGDSSTQAARRFLDALEDLATTYLTGTVIVVSHGGVTVDALRTLLGDRQLGCKAPTLIDSGVPACALTTLQRIGAGWTVRSIAATDHLSRRSHAQPDVER